MTEHLIAGRMGGPSSVGTFCTCGKVFMALSAKDTRAATLEAQGKADELWNAHRLNPGDPVECEECFALIAAHRVAAHAFWHDRLTETLRGRE